MESIQSGLHTARNAAAAVATASAGEYLSIRLGAEEYGIELLKVQEIRSYEAPLRIANAPRFVKGVLDLRGVIMPVVDLRLAFDCEQADTDPFTATVVLTVKDQLIGVVVDSVSDVIDLPAASIRPAPEMASNFETRFINGIAALQDRTLILMDVEALMSGPPISLISQGLRFTTPLESAASPCLV